MKTKNTVIGVLGLVLALGVAWSAYAAAYHSVIEDASIAFRIYNGDDANVTLAVTGTSTNYAFTIDGNANTVPGLTGADDTIGELAIALEACTNAAGTTAAGLNIFIDQDPSLAADLIDDEISTQTLTITPGTWGNVLWDTSIASGPGYNVYIPDNLPKGLAGWGDVTPGLSAGYTLTRITGNPGGTGDATTSVYLNRVLVWRQIDPAIIGTVTNQNININAEVNIPVQAGQAAIIRSDRATTETTGVLTVITE